MTDYSAQDVDLIRDAAPVWISPEGAVDILVELLNAGWRPPLRQSDDLDLLGPERDVFGELMLHQFGDPALRRSLAVSIVARLRRDGWMPKSEDEDKRRREVDDEFDRSMDAARREAQRVSALEGATFVVGHAIAAAGDKSINAMYIADLTLSVARRLEPYVRGDV